MIFHKASSFGNDFIAVAEGELGKPAVCRASRGELAQRICDRHEGVGADGVVFYRPGPVAGEAAPAADIPAGDIPLGDRPAPAVHFEVYNRDGGQAELSGNGMAALAAVLLRRRLGASPLILRTDIGARRVLLLERRGPWFRFDVEIGKPDFSDRTFFPFLRQGQIRYCALGEEFHPLSVGNPHAVVLCHKMPTAARLAALGKKLETHPLFPKRVNVEFVLPLGPSCRVFFYERGVGPTHASSTGSAAVFAVLRRLKMCGDRLKIQPLSPLPGNGGGNDAIDLHWQGGIHVETVTRLICKGRYFG